MLPTANFVMRDAPLPTPCIGRCSTVFGDLVCRGCKRFLHEIIDWNGYDEALKARVWQRLERLLVQVLEEKLVILDRQALRHQLELRQIRFLPELSPYCWAYQLLASGARHIRRLEAYGLALQPAFVGWALPELRDRIDQEFFALSEACYQQEASSRLEGLSVAARFPSAG